MFNLHNYQKQKFKTINQAELWRQKYYSKNNTFGKSKRPCNSILKLARKYGIKITIKRNGKRVYKSAKLIKKIILKKKKLRLLNDN